MADKHVISPIYHVASLGHALELCATAIAAGDPVPTFTVDAEEFERFSRYMAKSYTVHWKDASGKPVEIKGIMPLFQAVHPGEPRGQLV